MLIVSWRSEGAREACKIERLRPDPYRELEVGGCAGTAGEARRKKLTGSKEKKAGSIEIDILKTQ